MSRWLKLRLGLCESVGLLTPLLTLCMSQHELQIWSASPRRQTWGRSPSRKRSPTKPPERAPPSYGAKQGSVLPLDMRGTRRPSSVCGQQAIHTFSTHAPYSLCR
jgi:hypothetical protein